MTVMIKRGGPLARQQGISFISLIVLFAICGFFGVLGMKVIPTWVEYRAIKAAIVSAKTIGGTVRDMQMSFDRSADVNYISSLHGKDLSFTRVEGGTEISFAYESRIPIVGPVSLVIDYEGTTAKTMPGAGAKADTN